MTEDKFSQESAPGLDRLISESIRVALLETHTALPARVESFDAATQTATVVPELRRLAVHEDGEEQEISIAPIELVPVMFPRAGGMAITFPVEVGDKCLLVFGERDISGWLQTGEEGVPPAVRKHEYSDAVAILGLWPRPSALSPAPSSTSLEIRTDDGATTIAVSSSGVTVDSEGPITFTRGVNELLQVLSTALDLIGTSTVGGTPLSNAALIAAEKIKVDLIRSP